MEGRLSIIFFPRKISFITKILSFQIMIFFSPEPLKDAKELADIYYKAGFEEVEAKAGVHSGTFKVFVNFYSGCGYY